MDLFQNMIHQSRYARWRPDLGRRETWNETVTRYFDFFQDHLEEKCKYTLSPSLRSELQEGVENFHFLPSMRALMTAGPALARCNVAGYNCAYVPIDHPRAFDEAMYILMCGTGVGFSVERQCVAQLPSVAESFEKSSTTIVVDDSKEGWSKAYRELIAMLYAGQIPAWDMSKVRPAGAPLKTFGGRASGPAPLDDLFRFTVKKFRDAHGRRLSSLECHDLMCKIGEIVVVGGVRRCLPSDAPVALTTGTKPISQVEPGDVVVTGGKTARVVASGPSGKKAILKIKHRFGELACTPEHRVAVFNAVDSYAFKAAADLKVGDRLVWDGAGYEGQHTELPAFDEVLHFNSKIFNIPELTPRVAWLFGLIHGNGYIGDQTIEIAHHIDHLETLEEANIIFEDCFGLSGAYGSDGREGNGARLRVFSAPFARWLKTHLKVPNEPIRVPEFIMNALQPIRSAYLAGLFDSDGRSRKDKVIEQVTTIYPEYEDDLVVLLASLGIGCSRHFTCNDRRRAAGEKAKDAHGLFIVGRLNRKKWLDLVSPHIRTGKLVDIDAFGSPIDFTFPVAFIGGRSGYRAMNNITASALEMNPNGYLPTPVVSVEPWGEVETWDIEVEELHQFTTCGIVVHNSALLSLSNLSDDRMRYAKSGQWWESEPQRSLANNSVAYTEKPEIGLFMKEWLSLYESKSGERGIFNREAARKQILRTDRRDPDHEWGSNPCLEILLRPNQFCNLSTTVCRMEDDFVSLSWKTEMATLLGTFQSTLTNFKYLRKVWQRNTEEERLLGVSLTGIMGSTIRDFSGEALSDLRSGVVARNKRMASELGIPQSTATTCVKPEGTTSQLVYSPSGMHADFASYYVRTVRQDNKDPMTEFMKDQSFPNEPCVTKPNDTTIFSFPRKASAGSTTRDDMTAIQQLEMWLKFKTHWCEHTPSVTITVREHEWLEVGAWVYARFDDVTGVSFLPHTDHIYRQAPYQECTKEEYEALLERMPKEIDFRWMSVYEGGEDKTVGSQTLACTSGGCEI